MEVGKEGSRGKDSSNLLPRSLSILIDSTQESRGPAMAENHLLWRNSARAW